MALNDYSDHQVVKLAGLHDLCRVFKSVNYTVSRQFAPVITEVFVHVKISYSRLESDTLEMFSYAVHVWGPVVQWLVQRFRSERLRVRSRRSATFTPSALVRRQSLPVWPPTLNKIPLPLPL